MPESVPSSAHHSFAYLGGEQRSIGAGISAQPQTAWKLYEDRLPLYLATEPYTGFYVPNKFAKTMPHGDFVVTNNVDGQSQKAGYQGDRIMEIHGSLHYFQCNEPCVSVCAQVCLTVAASRFPRTF